MCILLILLSLPFNPVISQNLNWTNQCPSQCQCDIDQTDRRRISCSQGYLNHIPTRFMDKSVQVLRITAPKDKPNDISIGRIFMNFDELETISITDSNLRAIGDASFWPGHSLRSIDLSNNQISLIKESDFYGLTELDELNLSNNLLSIPPSASFYYLVNLTKLVLARNKLTKLVPRMFYQLTKLEYLDLSGNPLSNINSDGFNDVTRLKKLILADCKLTTMHELTYSKLSELEELDLRNNALTVLHSNDFKYLQKLKQLHLSGNQLTAISNKTFLGHKLEKLDLSNNMLHSIASCAFCNSSIKEMDISKNHFHEFKPNILVPLQTSLLFLNAANNSYLLNSSSSLYNLLSPLRKLQSLYLSHMNIDDKIGGDIFSNLGHSLISLDLSNNHLTNLTTQLFSHFRTLKDLDLSYNRIKGIPYPVIKTISAMSTLDHLTLSGKYWSCYRCHILPIKDWLANNPIAYDAVCKKGKGLCIRCSEPNNLVSRHVADLNEFDLEWCIDPSIQLRLSASEPKMGFILAVIIIITLICIIIIVIISYRKRGAVYYTHEDEKLDEKTVFSIQQAANLTTTDLFSPPSLSTTSNSSSSSSSIIPSPLPSPSLSPSSSSKSSSSFSTSKISSSSKTQPLLQDTTSVLTMIETEPS